MDFNKIKQYVWNLLFKNDLDFVMNNVSVDEELIKVKEDNNKLNKATLELFEEIKSLQQDIIKKDIEIKNITEHKTEVDIFCEQYFKPIKNIAYKQKREIKGAKYSIFLNELVTPNSFEVLKLKKQIDFNVESNFKLAYNIGKVVCSTLTWDDDKNLSTSGDYYLYPNEAIARGLCDCEDHTFVTMSMSDKIAGAWGFYNGGGHAFNVFILENKLYVLDTVADMPIIIDYNSQSAYKICYIITQNYTYAIDEKWTFGEIAWL